MIVHSDDYHYGRFLARRWEIGEPFILIEHDICPWVGAIRELENCERDFCGFATRRHATVALGLGLVKITPSGPVPEGLNGASWQRVEGPTLITLSARHGPQHLHSPPVAHARLP